jgi:hypothetical protein
MRENRPSVSEGGAGVNPLFLPLSAGRRISAGSLIPKDSSHFLKDSRGAYEFVPVHANAHYLE